MTHKVLAAAPCALALFFVAGVSSAQTAPVDSPAWLRDRQYTEGIGIRTGDFELHPGIAGEVGYDSNWLLRSDRSACNTMTTPPCDNGPPVVPALEFRITPSLSLSTIGPQRREGDLAPIHPTVAFRMGVNATWRIFAGLSSDSSGALDISKQTEGIPSLGADARLSILPGEPVGGAVFANWIRTQLPNETNVSPDQSFDHDDVGGGGELALQPNSGTLDAHIGYQYNATLFEASQALGLSNGSHQAFLRERWRFRPRTALLYDANIRFNSYNNPTEAMQQGLVGSTPIRMRFGMNGLVTNRLAVMLLAGWASSLYDTTADPAIAQQQYDTVIGQAELTWFLAPGPGIAETPALGLALSAITLGYNRDFSNSYLANYYGIDRGYLRFNYFFGGRALVTLEGGVAGIEYPDIYWLTPAPVLRHTKFTDYRLDATLFGEYRFSDTTGLNATIRYTSNISNVHDMPDVTPGGGQGVFDMSWNRLEAFLGFRWFM